MKSTELIKGVAVAVTAVSLTGCASDQQPQFPQPTEACITAENPDTANSIVGDTYVHAADIPLGGYRSKDGGAFVPLDEANRAIAGRQREALEVANVNLELYNKWLEINEQAINGINDYSITATYEYGAEGTWVTSTITHQGAPVLSWTTLELPGSPKVFSPHRIREYEGSVRQFDSEGNIIYVMDTRRSKDGFGAIDAVLAPGLMSPGIGIRLGTLGLINSGLEIGGPCDFVIVSAGKNGKPTIVKVVEHGPHLAYGHSRATILNGNNDAQTDTWLEEAYDAIGALPR